MNESDFARMLLMVAISVAMLSCDGAAPPTSKPPAPAAEKKRVLIACTTPLIHEIVVFLGEDRVDSVCLFKTGGSLIAADLDAAATTALRNADVVLAHGLADERRLMETIEANSPRDRIHRLKMAAMNEGENSGKTKGVSLAPDDVVELIDLVAATMITADPQSKSLIDARYSVLQTSIKDLAIWMEAQWTAIASERRVVVTDDEQLASVLRGCGCSAIVAAPFAGLHPTVADRERLLVSVRQAKASAIAIATHDSEMMEEMLQEIAKETGARIVRTPLLAWPTAEVGYVAMMKANVTALVAAVKK